MFSKSTVSIPHSFLRDQGYRADQGTDRDLIGEIAEAAKKHGVVFGAYFSKADWHAGTRAAYYVCIICTQNCCVNVYGYGT